MELECKRCDYLWIQRGESKPKTCPNCNSRVWNKELSPYWQGQKEIRNARIEAFNKQNGIFEFEVKKKGGGK